MTEGKNPTSQPFKVNNVNWINIFCIKKNLHETAVKALNWILEWN